MRRFARSCFWLLALLGVALARGPVAASVAGSRLIPGPELRAADDRDRRDDRSRNRAPSVSAGPDQTIVLPASATLAGSVTDQCLSGGDGRDDDRREGDRGDHDAPHLSVQWTKVSGPGSVTFASRTSPKTSASFSAAGTYILRLTANDGALSASDDVTITVKPAVPVNKAPIVNAGADQTITLPAGAALKGTVSDDGLPAGATVTSKWSKVSGPGTVTFANASSLTTTATFSVAGTYCLKLTASDTKLSASSDVTITVKAGAINKAPVVNAGADQTITLPATAALKGTVTDDGLPVGATVTSTWSKTSGPGTVTFASASSLTTAATFGQAGTYVLRLTASDSVLSAFDEVAVIVKPAPPTNQPPTVNAGANATITLPATVPLSGVVTDDGLPTGATVTSAWTKFSGPGGVTFANAASVVTTATFDQAGTYVLRLTASDTLLSASSDVTITVNPPIVTPPTNQPPTVNAGANATITLPAGASLSGVVTDDGLPTGATVTSAWTKFSGPGAVTFVNAARAVTTATFDQAGTYVLRLTASDTLLSASSDVTITVNPPIVTPPTNLPPTVNAGPNATITLPAGASLSGVVTDDGLPAGSTVTSTWSKFSGPGSVTFANAASPVTTATFDQAGTYVLRLTASDTLLSASSDVTITVNPPIVTPPTNQPPTVNAGANATITLPAGASLSGVVADDGLPTGATVTSAWTKFSGPGAVTFANATSAVTTATFDQAGTYVLRLTASDTLLSASSDVTITVNPPIVTPPTNQPPTVNAGANATITLPAGASLSGVVTDDGLPTGATVTSAWTKFSGPGIVTFANVASAVTTATFDQAGTYVLRLTASDTLLSASSDVTITVNPPIVTPPTNQPPTVNAGANATITLPAGASLSGVVTDDGLPTGATVTTAWTKFSGPGGVTFANVASAVTTATFDQAGTYVLRLTASDTLLSASSDVTITVNPPIVTPPTNQPPTVNAGANATITLPAGASLSGVVTDDGLPTGATVTSAWTKFSGPGAVTFANATSPVTTATFDQAGTYVLRLTASDTLLSASSDVTITVNPPIVTPPTNQPPTVNAGANATITLPAGASLSGVVTDDGLPTGAAVTTAWTKFSGPGIVTFANAASAVTTATFDQAGSYVLQLTASDTLLSAFSDVTITVNNPVPTNISPIARIGGPYSGSTGAPIAFDGSLSSDPDLDALSFAWSFGDGSTGSGPKPSHTYATADQFTVTLTVSDGRGGSSSAASVASVAQTNRPPTASAGGPYTGDAGSPIGFTGSASDPDHDALTLGWDYGDGSQGTGQAPSHIYAAQGTYTVTLSVSDGHGASTSATSSVVVGPAADRAPPVVKLSAPTTALPGTQTVVTADAADNVGVADVSFDVEGAASSQVATMPYRRVVDIPALAAPGTTIKIKATARDAANNTGTDQATITIVAAPDTTPPTVSIQLPPQASPGTTITVSASAADAGGVQFVSFASAGVPFATDTASPYSVLFVVPPDAAPGSTLSFVARASDFANNVAESGGQVPIVATPDTQPPTVALAAPDSVVQGAAIHLTAAAADNVQVASVDFLLDDVVVGTAIASPFSAEAASSRPAGSVLRVRARARDSSGNQAFSDRETRVVSAAASGAAVLTGKVYDDTTGLPLSGALVALAGVDGNGQPYTATATSDDRGAYYLNASSGHGTLQIARAGWTRVDRPIDVPASQALRVFDARLTPMTGGAVSVPAIVGGTVQAGDALLTIASGGLAVDTALRVTSVGQQGLAGPLPLGWSPAGIVDITPHGVDFTAPQTMSLSNRLKLPLGTNVIVAAWDEAASAWRAVGAAAIAGDASRLGAAIVSSGQYAWLVADTLPVAPPVPGSGSLVDGVARGIVPDPASIHITPQPKVVFYKPGVNSTVGAVLDSPLPSGTPLRARLVESYTFTSADAARPDPFVEDLVFYQRPGPNSTVSASFIVTPSLTFDPIDLKQGVITVELGVPSDVNSKPTVGPDGGTVGAPTGEALQVSAGAFSANVPIDIEALTLEALGAALPPELSFIGGASVAFSGATPGVSAVLTIPRPPLVDGSSPIVLLRLAPIEGKTRLLIVGIGRVVGTKIVSDAVVPGAAAILDGVSTAGRYLFVRGTSPLAFATGTVTAADGHALARALVTTAALPIVALSDALGRYVVPVGVGAVTITARDLQKQDTQTIQRTVAAAGTVVSADVPLSVLSLTITSLTPAEGATSVALSAAIVATFSAPIDPATLIGPSASGIVVKTLSGGVIPGAISLSAGNTRATFRPASLLSPNGSYSATISTDVKDLAGRPLSAAAVTHFTSLDTTPPVAPAAGSITATIPDANGFTTVTGTQGTAAVHDTISIVNKTKKTSFPALVQANGGFSATFAVGLGDMLVVAITDPNGNQTVVPMPRFKRTNADGSMASVVGSEGGHLDGPGGTAVDVPAGALPDGTIVTITAIDEASFPTKLTDEQKQFFAFSGGIGLDFGGATPSQYLNVSLPPKGGETFTDRWIIGQVVMDGGQQVLNVVDTARLIDDRITTSSPPCPGVQAAGKYAALKPFQHSVGVMFGRFSSGSESTTMRFSQPLFGSGAAGVSLPYVLQSTPASLDICIPALAGKVTVQPNSQKVVIPAQTFAPIDRQVIVRNQRLNREFFYPHNVADYRFLVEGTGTDKFKVTVIGPTEQPVVPRIYPGSTPGFVNIVLDITTLNLAVSAVKIENLTRHTSPRIFNQSDSAVELPVVGGKDDGYEVTIVDANGGRRTITPPPVVKSPTGGGNLIARAQYGTIDPDTAVYLMQFDTHDPDHLLITHERLIDNVVDGGFEFPFIGDESETFLLKVTYPNEPGRLPDQVPIPAVVISISNPVLGRVISTLNALVPPPDMPYPLGKIAGDRRAPGIKSTPDPLIGFDPTRSLSFTFTEGVTRESVESDHAVVLVDDSGAAIRGTVRLSNQNKTVTFVPDAPLRLNAGYTLTFNYIRDASDNMMARADFRITTVGPSVLSASAILNLLEQLTIVKKPGPGGATQTLAFGMTGDLGQTHAVVILDVTKPNQPVVLSTIPADDGGRVTVLRDLVNLETGRSAAAYPKQDDVIPCGGSAGKKRFTGDLLIVSTYTVGAASAIRFYDITNPRDASCLVGSKLLTVNPAKLGDNRSDGAVRSEFNIARTVVTLRDGARWKAYAAIENVGLMMVDVGLNIPSTSTTNLAPEPYAPGSYVDVVAANGRLIAIDRGNTTLDILDASLTRFSSTPIPLLTIRGLAYADALPIDLNGDSQIGQNEVRDLAFVGGIGGVDIVDVTDFGAPTVIGSVPIDAEIYSLDFDAEKRKLFAGGRAPTVNGEYRVFIIDLSGPDPFTPLDRDGNPQDDRIVWQSAVGTYAAGAMFHRALRYDSDTRTLYIGNSRSYDTLRLDPNLTGQATYTFFRATEQGLDYAHGLELPIRGAVVELRRPGAADGVEPVQKTNTDETGFYTFFGAPVGEPLEVVVRAILGSAAKPTATVVDNTNSRKIYSQSSGVFTLGPTGTQTHDILAKTVWNAAARRHGVRDGAPFAILDDVYQAQTTLRSVDPKIDFTPPIALAWSVKNSPSKTAVKAKGLLGKSGAHYAGSETTLYLSGKENNDTDEYDVQVILHEWSHYFMDKFSRDDTPAGTHSDNYILDPRGSFSEGFATAFAAMMTNDPNYVDTMGRAQRQGFLQALEPDSHRADSFYSEGAVQELLWDLFDGTGTEIDIETGHSGGFFDAVELGVKPIYDAMRNGVRNTPGFTTIFPFLADVMAPILADPALKPLGEGIIALAKGENISLDTADQFEQFEAATIANTPPVKIGRLYTPVPTDDTVVATFGPGTPFAGQPLETNTRYDAKKPNDDNNRLDESVYFKFDVAKGASPDVDARRPYIVTVTPVSGGFFSLSVNQHTDSGKPLVSVDNSGSPILTACLEPGTHAAVVRAYDLIGKNRFAATRRFTIQIRPTVIINGKAAGSCSPDPTVPTL